MEETVLRFLIGGALVSLFAMLGDVLRPKSFAGLFGAAPSIALATVGLTLSHQGKPYLAIEARSMTLGAIAFVLYAYLVSRALLRFKRSTMVTTIALMAVWFVTSFGLYQILL